MMMVQANLVRALLLVAATAAVVLHLAPVVQSHALIGKPMSRNLWALVDPTSTDKEFVPSGMNGGTGEFTNPGLKLKFPYSIHAKCGEWLKNIPRKYDNMRPSFKPDTYAPGSTIDFHIITSADHGGRHLFRVCPYDFTAGQEETQCVNMTRADGKGEVWYYPPPGKTDPFATKYKWPADGPGQIANTPTYIVKFKLPSSLPFTGNQHVIQWFWATGNTCTPPPCTPNDATCALNPGLPPCEATPEVYFNCMDVIIGGGGAATPAPYPTETPPATPTETPAVPSTAETPAEIPTETPAETPTQAQSETASSGALPSTSYPVPAPTSVPTKPAPAPVHVASAPTPVLAPKVPTTKPLPTVTPSTPSSHPLPTPRSPVCVPSVQAPTSPSCLDKKAAKLERKLILRNKRKQRKLARKNKRKNYSSG